MDFSTFPISANVAVFAIAAAGVWLSGSYLSTFVDLLAERTGMGEAFAGVLLLGFATSLPEIATTATASLSGDAALAGSNLFGGVALQIAILALVDATAMRGRALTFFSSEPALLMQGVLLILLTAVAGAAVVAGEPGSIAGVGVWSLLLAVGYVAALWMIYRYERHSQWAPTCERAEPPQSAADLKDDRSHRYGSLSTARIWLSFGFCCVGVLGTGWAVAETGGALAEQTGLGSSLVGATLVALATSLPEVSTTFAAVRMGAYAMAVGNIFGTNCLEVALFPFADAFYRGGLIFDATDPSTGFLAYLAIAMTCIYLWGILERRDKTIFGMGQDSAAILFLYLAGMGVYFAIRPL